MRSILTITLVALFATTLVLSQIPGGWGSESNLVLDESSKALINFGLQEISRINAGFDGRHFVPVKILSKENHVVAGINSLMLVVIDNGQNNSDSKKLLKMTVFTNLRGDKKLINWETLDLSLNYTSLNNGTILEQIKTRITTLLGQKNQATYNVKSILAKYQTQRFGTPFYYVKAVVESTRNSIEVHEFVFVKQDLQLFTTFKSAVSRSVLQSHPLLDLARGVKGLICSNLASEIFCELAPNCLNRMATEGVCETKN